MPHRICPQCERPGRLLETASQNAWVIYHRCDACGHVWTYDKKDPDAPPRDVTTPVAVKSALEATGYPGRQSR
jgi:hypothetical protein